MMLGNEVSFSLNYIAIVYSAYDSVCFIICVAVRYRQMEPKYWFERIPYSEQATTMENIIPIADVEATVL